MSLDIRIHPRVVPSRRDFFCPCWSGGIHQRLVRSKKEDTRRRRRQATLTRTNEFRILQILHDSNELSVTGTRKPTDREKQRSAPRVGWSTTRTKCVCIDPVPTSFAQFSIRSISPSEKKKSYNKSSNEKNKLLTKKKDLYTHMKPKSCCSAFLDSTDEARAFPATIFFHYFLLVLS
jgi:hypothetical protein